MKKLMTLVLGSILVAGLTGAARAQAPAEANGWSYEVVPYAWLMNLDGDLTVGGQTVEVEAKFSDMISDVDLAGSVLFTAAKDRLILWAEGDYVSVNKDGDAPVGEVEVDSDSSFLAAGMGYRLDEFCPYAQADLMLGARYLGMENSLDIPGVGSRSRDSSLLDPVLGVRLNVRFSDNWRLGLPVSVGAGGDSELVVDVMPNLHYQFTETVSGRLGYRYLYYDFEEGQTSFKGSYSGLMLGVGLAW